MLMPRHRTACDASSVGAGNELTVGPRADDATGGARVVPQEHWKQIIAGMREACHARRLEEGLAATIDAVDEQLARPFPVPADAVNPNELPNRPERC